MKRQEVSIKIGTLPSDCSVVIEGVDITHLVQAVDVRKRAHDTTRVRLGISQAKLDTMTINLDVEVADMADVVAVPLLPEGALARLVRAAQAVADEYPELLVVESLADALDEFKKAGA